jgi:hypothetical protein
MTLVYTVKADAMTRTKCSDDGTHKEEISVIEIDGGNIWVDVIE